MKMITKMIVCPACGNEFAPYSEYHYIARDGREIGALAAFKSAVEPTLYDAFDCPACGCQYIAGERKYINCVEEMLPEIAAEGDQMNKDSHMCASGLMNEAMVPAPRIKVTEAVIIVTRIGESWKPYYEIKYKEVGDSGYTIGYGSYSLKNVFEWYDECFEIVKDDVNAKT